MVVGNVAGIVILDLARRVRVGIPNRWAFAVLVPGTLNLIRGGSGAPEESLGKLAPRGLLIRCLSAGGNPSSHRAKNCCTSGFHKTSPCERLTHIAPPSAFADRRRHE